MVYFARIFVIPALAGLFPAASFAWCGTGVAEIGAGLADTLYTESTTLAGRALASRMAGLNPVQHAGAYFPCSRDLAVSVTARTSVGTPVAREQWFVDGFGVVQTNDIRTDLNELQLTGFFTREHRRLSGSLKIFVTDFTRSQKRSTPGTAVLNAWLKEQWIAAGGDAGAFGGGLDPDAETGVITERAVNVVAAVGYQQKGVAVLASRHFDWNYGLSLGLPIYYQVTNSDLPGVVFRSVFTGGTDFDAGIGGGWYIRPRLRLGAGLQITLNTRRAQGTTQRLPYNTTRNASALLTARWDLNS